MNAKEPTNRRRLKIRTKLVLLVGLLLGAVAVLNFAYVPSRARASRLRAVASEANAVARLTAYTVTPALLFGDPRSAQDILTGAQHSGRVDHVVVTDQNGDVVAKVPATLVWRRGAPGWELPGSHEGFYWTSAAVERGGEALGTVFVGTSLAPVDAETAEVLRTTVLLGSLFLLAGVLAAMAIGSFVTRPLREMVETAREIGGGNWERRAPGGDDETGELAESFNMMLDRLAASRRQLEDLNGGLERRVAERTATLAEEVRVRQLSEEASRLANERFVLAAAAIQGAVYEHDLSTDRIAWSDGLSRVFGHAQAVTTATAGWWTRNIHPEDRARVHRALADAVKRGESFVAEYRFRSGKGSYVEVLDRGQVVRDPSGAVRGTVGVIEDVSPLRRLEEQYHHAQRMEAIGRLAGGVAHDFNNLLTVILGNCEVALLKLHGDGAPVARHIDEVSKAAERAAALTHQLLTFSRKQVVRPHVLDLNEMVEGLTSMMERLVGEHIRVDQELAPCDLTVRADRGQLEQVLVNIIVNARDAMPSGGTIDLVTCRVELGEPIHGGTESVPAGCYVAIEVRDTGCGMDDDTKRRIFEPFFTTKGVGVGTGLGMATVYGIVKQSGGYIQIDSAPDAGTTIRILLPEALPEAQPAVASEAPSEPPTGSETLLVVEDEAAVRELVTGMLRASGYHVLPAANAGEALSIAEGWAGPIDLVLTDVVMPGLGGRQLVDELRRRRPALPAIFASGYTDDTILHHGISADQVPFLSKPFRRSELLTKVRDVLDTSQRQVVPDCGVNPAVVG